MSVSARKPSIAKQCETKPALKHFAPPSQEEEQQEMHESSESDIADDERERRDDQFVAAS